jgi:hypothetical protein
MHEKQHVASGFSMRAVHQFQLVRFAEMCELPPGLPLLRHGVNRRGVGYVGRCYRIANIIDRCDDRNLNPGSGAEATGCHDTLIVTIHRRPDA